MITKDKVTKRQAEKARAAIKAGQIIKRLQSYFLGEPAVETCECGKEYELFNISEDTLKKLNPSQVRTGLGLISHVLPKPQEITISDVVEEPNREEMADKIANYLKGMDTNDLIELEKRGVKVVILSKTQLKVV